MGEAKKTTFGVVALIGIYIALSFIGMYYMVEIVVFPIVAIPCIVYFIRHTLDLKEHIAIQICILLGIYIVTGNLFCMIVYLISVFIPAIIISNLYNREYTLPSIVMVTTVVFSAVIFIFLTIMKPMGIDFEAQYISSLDSMKDIFTSELDKLEMGKSETLVPEVIIKSKELIDYMIYAMKKLYSSTIIVSIMFSMGVIVMISNTLARISNKRLPSIRQFLEFKLSKITVLLFFCAVLAAAGTTEDIWMVLGLNIMMLLSNLFIVVGLFALIELVSRIKNSVGLKAIAYAMVFILFIRYNSIIMTFGCLDTLFNYRKAKIVV